MRRISILMALAGLLAAAGCSGGSKSGSSGTPGGSEQNFQVKINQPPVGGTVASSDAAQISCGASSMTVVGTAPNQTYSWGYYGSGATLTNKCSGTYAWTSTSTAVAVTLSATPASGYVFVGWAGDCKGSGPCDLKGPADRMVVAIFAKQGEQGHVNFLDPASAHATAYNTRSLACGRCHGESYQGQGIAPRCDLCHAMPAFQGVAPVLTVTSAGSVTDSLVQVSVAAADPDALENISCSAALLSQPSGSAAALVGGAATDCRAALKTVSFTPVLAGSYVVRVTVSDGVTAPVVRDVTIAVTAAPVGLPTVELRQRGRRDRVPGRAHALGGRSGGHQGHLLHRRGGHAAALQRRGPLRRRRRRLPRRGPAGQLHAGVPGQLRGPRHRRRRRRHPGRQGRHRRRRLQVHGRRGDRRRPHRRHPDRHGGPAAPGHRPHPGLRHRRDGGHRLPDPRQHLAGGAAHQRQRLDPGRAGRLGQPALRHHRRPRRRQLRRRPHPGCPQRADGAAARRAAGPALVPERQQRRRQGGPGGRLLHGRLLARCHHGDGGPGLHRQRGASQPRQHLLHPRERQLPLQRHGDLDLRQGRGPLPLERRPRHLPLRVQAHRLRPGRQLPGERRDLDRLPRHPADLRPPDPERLLG